MAATFTLVSYIHKYHVYKDIWDPSLGESIHCEHEDRNPQDPYAAQAVILIYSPRGSLELHHFVTTRNSLFTASIVDWDILFSKEVWLYISLKIVKQILRARVTHWGTKTVKILGCSHPRNFIRENPDWLLNHEIYIPRKFPSIW